VKLRYHCGGGSAHGHSGDAPEVRMIISPINLLWIKGPEMLSKVCLPVGLLRTAGEMFLQLELLLTSLI